MQRTHQQRRTGQVAAVLIAEGSEQQNRVQVDVRIEECERQCRHDDDLHRWSHGVGRQQHLTSAGTPERVDGTSARYVTPTHLNTSSAPGRERTTTQMPPMPSRMRTSVGQSADRHGDPDVLAGYPRRSQVGVLCADCNDEGEAGHKPGRDHVTQRVLRDSGMSTARGRGRRHRRGRLDSPRVLSVAVRRGEHAPSMDGSP